MYIFVIASLHQTEMKYLKSEKSSALYADLVIVNFMGGHYQEYILKKTITIKKDSIYAYNTKLTERETTQDTDLIVHFIRLVMYLAPERRSAYSYNLNVYTTPS